MNAITTTAGLSATTVEQVLGTGNLGALSPKQRVEFYVAACRSVGLNPLTRPFRFLSFQGQTVMYATRDCADQLRSLKGVNIQIARKGIEDDLYVVEVEATDARGRKDADLGAVPIGALKGEARANAIMKATTKAKRRVTLSICGLGLMDESEAESLAGARHLPDDAIEGVAEDVTIDPPAAPASHKPTVAEWLGALEAQVAIADRAELDRILAREDVVKAQNGLKNGALDRLNAIFKEALDRLATPAEEAKAAHDALLEDDVVPF